MKRLDPNGISGADLALCLARVMETDPDHELVVAARLALEIGYARASRPFNIEDFVDGRYHRAPEIAAYSELQKLRWPPTGDRDLWVQYGPAGPPSDELQSRRAA